MKIQMWHVILIVAVVAMAAGDGVYGFYQAHQPLAIPAENRKTFVHAVVGSDSTRSMRNESVAAGKEIIDKRIIPSIGPGDRLVCLNIGPRYGLSNTVFGGTFEDQPPQIPEGRRAQPSGTRDRTTTWQLHVPALPGKLRARPRAESRPWWVSSGSRLTPAPGCGARCRDWDRSSRGSRC
jgi:hypothetical protein